MFGLFKDKKIQQENIKNRDQIIAEFNDIKKYCDARTNKVLDRISRVLRDQTSKKDLSKVDREILMCVKEIKEYYTYKFYEVSTDNTYNTDLFIDRIGSLVEIRSKDNPVVPELSAMERIRLLMYKKYDEMAKLQAEINRIRGTSELDKQQKAIKEKELRAKKDTMDLLGAYLTNSLKSNELREAIELGQSGWSVEDELMMEQDEKIANELLQKWRAEQAGPLTNPEGNTDSAGVGQPVEQQPAVNEVLNKVTEKNLAQMEELKDAYLQEAKETAQKRLTQFYKTQNLLLQHKNADKGRQQLLEPEIKEASEEYKRLDSEYKTTMAKYGIASFKYSLIRQASAQKGNQRLEKIVGNVLNMNDFTAMAQAIEDLKMEDASNYLLLNGLKEESQKAMSALDTQINPPELQTEDFSNLYAQFGI